jgi:RimJ/RimL family protein N-acetyltransferase/acyl carrier protein
MKTDRLLKILNKIKPLDDTKTITYISLDQLKKKNFEEFFIYSQKEEFFEFFERPAISKRHQFNSFVKNLIDTEKKNHKSSTYQKFWLILDSKINRVVGSAKLTNLDPIRKSVEWGYGVDFKLWGSNYILRIQSTLLDYIFNNLNLNRLYGATHVNNYRVIKAIEKLGFRKEGLKYDYYFDQRKKKFFDAYSYSFLKSDFEKKKLSKNKKKLTNIDFPNINKLISKALNKKIPIDKNVNMNDILEWDSVSHYDVICIIEKKFGKKLSNKEMLMCTSTENICKILEKN